jgi:hypothetical protein
MENRYFALGGSMLGLPQVKIHPAFKKTLQPSTPKIAGKLFRVVFCGSVRQFFSIIVLRRIYKSDILPHERYISFGFMSTASQPLNKVEMSNM